MSFLFRRNDTPIEQRNNNNNSLIELIKLIFSYIKPNYMIDKLDNYVISWVICFRILYDGFMLIFLLFVLMFGFESNEKEIFLNYLKYYFIISILLNIIGNVIRKYFNHI